MRIGSTLQLNHGRQWRASYRAFTYVEMLVASTVFLLVVAAMLVGNSFGMRMMELYRPKLAAAGEIRKTIYLLHSEIGAAKVVRVGRGDRYTFRGAGFGEPREGNAMQIYPAEGTNITNFFIRYYLDSGDRSLKRMTSDGVSATVVARAIGNTNDVVFVGEDFAGKSLTNDQNNMAIRVSLQYMQMAGSSTPIGPANYYKAHRVETRKTVRER
jgi:hypothetical protein